MDRILDMKEEFQELRKKAGLMQTEDCSQEDNRRYARMEKEGMPLPKGVYRYGSIVDDETEYFVCYEADLTETQVREYLMLKQFKDIRIIRNCVIFFTVLTVISMIVAFLAML